MLGDGPVVRTTKVGDKIKIKEHLHGEEDKRVTTYTIIKIYRHMVMAETEDHRRKCFAYGNLVVAGLEKQADAIEALRKYTQEELKECEKGIKGTSKRKKK